MENIPFIAYEANMARMERINKRLVIMCMILITLLFVSNVAWIYYESQFEDATTTVTQELDSSDGGSAIINDGVHINGENQTDSNY